MCQHPKLASTTSYVRGCRCSRCVEGNSAYHRQYGAEGIRHAKRRLTGIRTHAKKGGFKELIASPEQVVEWLEQTHCEFCLKSLDDRSDRLLHHNHTTGEFIAVCCQKCNICEGHLRTLDRDALARIIQSIQDNP